MSNPQILSITPGITGLAGVSPAWFSIKTADTVATVTTAGYLNHAVAEGLIQPHNADIAAVTTVLAGVPSTAWYNISITGTPGAFVYSLVAI